MVAYGTILAQIYTSSAQLPVVGATVAVTQPTSGIQHRLIALRVTDKNGRTAPIQVPAPSRTQSLSPDVEDAQPFAPYDLWVQATGYEVAHIKDMQVFPSTQSIQKIALIPLPEHTPLRSRGEVFTIPPQDL